MISGLLRKRATANPFTWASCSSWSSNGHTSTTLWQKIRSVPHFLQHTSDRQRARVKRKNVCKSKGVTRWSRTWKHILRHESFPREIPVRGRFFFFERRFQPLSVGGFFSYQRESISWCLKSPFPSKTQNRQIARTLSFNRLGELFWLSIAVQTETQSRSYFICMRRSGANAQSIAVQKETWSRSYFSFACLGPWRMHDLPFAKSSLSHLDMLVFRCGLRRLFSPSSPNTPLKTEVCSSDGRKNKTVVFLPSNAVRELARRTTFAALRQTVVFVQSNAVCE